MRGSTRMTLRGSSLSLFVVVLHQMFHALLTDDAETISITFFVNVLQRMGLREAREAIKVGVVEIDLSARSAEECERRGQYEVR